MNELISFELLLPFAIFGAFAASAFWVLEKVAVGKPRSLERLEELKKPIRKRGAGEPPAVKNSSTVGKMLELATPTLSKPLQPKSEAEMGKLKTKLSYAGFRSESAVPFFLGLKFAGLLLGLFLGGVTVFSLQGLGQKQLFMAIAFGGLLFYLPDLIVRFIGSSRQKAIFLGLPDALDLMVVCVEAGLGIDQAMRKVSEEMNKAYPILAQEFGLCNLQLQMGRPKNDVLHELGIRTGVADLRALSGVLIQADKFGSSVAQALRVQSDSMRTRRRQIAEEKAAKTAVKLIFPLVIFIFPGIFVVLVGPAAITMVREMFPKMGGG